VTACGSAGGEPSAHVGESRLHCKDSWSTCRTHMAAGRHHTFLSGVRRNTGGVIARNGRERTNSAVSISPERHRRPRHDGKT